MRRYPGLSSVLFVFVVLFVVGLCSLAGAQDLGEVTKTLTDQTAQAKTIAAGIITLLSVLLTIAIVVALYNRTGKQ